MLDNPNVVGLLWALVGALSLISFVGLVREIRILRKRRVAKIIQQAMLRQLQLKADMGSGEQFDAMCDFASEVVYKLHIPFEFVVPNDEDDEEKQA